MNALPFPEGISYKGTELTTDDSEKKSLRILCEPTEADLDMRYVNRDVLRFDGVMLFCCDRESGRVCFRSDRR